MDLIFDHVVQSRVVFPGAGYLELVRASASTGKALYGVFFLQPLALETAGLLVECAIVDGRFEVRSGEGDSATTDATVHCSGALAATNGGWQCVEHAALSARSCARAAHVGALYDGFDAVGLQYGPATARSCRRGMA